jgi:polysaccharide export outer membrane protein
MRNPSRALVVVSLVMFMLLAGCGSKKAMQPLPPEQKVSGKDQYVIGPEDVLQIEVWREKNLSGTIPVRMDGKISLPLVYDVQAAGLTPLELKENLREKLKEFVDDAQVSVAVVEANSFKVYVSGQIKTPGVFKLRTEMTLLQIIPMAGGFTDWANQKKILVVRKEGGTEKRIRVNYKKMVDGKEPAFVLKPDDTIIVP